MTCETMRALMCVHFGPPEELRLREVPVPQPGPGEIQIKVYAVGLNFLDSLIIDNKYQTKPTLPFAPGSELSGQVTAVGPGVTRFQPGDKVAALTIWGGLAEFAVAREDQPTHVPDSMDLETASIFGLVYGTTFYAFKQRARLQPNESVLVLGASGGVGVAAVEVARAMGARVIAAASSASKLEIARSHGADDLINYSEVDLKTRVRELTDGRGVDVVYDPVGEPLAGSAFRALAWEGRYLIIGFAGGQIPALPFNLALVKSASMLGVFWGEFVERSPEEHRGNMSELCRLHAEGLLKPHIGGRYDLATAGAGIRQIMDRSATGKLIALCT